MKPPSGQPPAVSVAKPPTRTLTTSPGTTRTAAVTQPPWPGLPPNLTAEPASSRFSPDAPHTVATMDVMPAGTVHVSGTPE